MDVVVAMDWTDYDADGQATQALKLVTRHGRATPLVWLSAHKDDLKDTRNDYEDAPAGRGAARRRHRDYPGRPRLRRHQAVRVPHGTGLRLRYPAEGQHQGQCGRRDDPPGGRVDWPRRPSAQAARRGGY